MSFWRRHLGTPADKMGGLHWRRRVLLIFGVALLVRVAFVLALQNAFYFPDSVEYTEAANSLLTTGSFGKAYSRAPAYPVFLAGVFALFGQEIMTIRLVEALSGACLAVLIAIIAARMAGEQVGLLAGLLWGIYPLGIFVAGLVYPTGLATMLLACAVLCLVTEADRPLTPSRVLACGLFVGLVALTIPVALASAAAMSLWLAYWQPTRRLLLVALLLIGVLLPLVPWTVRNYQVYDRLVIVEPRLVTLLPAVGEARTSGSGEQSIDKFTAIRRNPEEYARRFVQEFSLFWELYPRRIVMTWPSVRESMHDSDVRIVRETVFGTSWTNLVSILSVGPVFLFALIGTAAMVFRKEQRPHLSLLIGTIMSFAVTYAFFWGKMRYRVPVEPYIIILSAYGLWLVSLTVADRVLPHVLPIRKQVR